MRGISRRLVGIGAALALGFGAASAEAQTVWRMPTEYPASAMPGEGLSAFAAAVAKRADWRLVIEPGFDATLKSAEVPKALAEGRIEAGDAFGGSLGGTDPLFALSSLPFVIGSVGDAERLAAAARPAYERAFAAKGIKLLYTTPWPPSGLWTKDPLASASDLRALAVRTYDATSTAVLTAVGAKALNISFADAQARVKDGSVNAVLSSGDGGAGRKLWEQLPHFTELNYTVPLSFAVASLAAYESLTPDLRRVVDEAAAETEARQWGAIGTRLEENYRRMRENGVMIRTDVDPAIMTALKQAAAEAVADWRIKAGPAAALLDKQAR